jgi:hypothetical protein
MIELLALRDKSVTASGPFGRVRAVAPDRRRTPAAGHEQCQTRRAGPEEIPFPHASLLGHEPRMTRVVIRRLARQHPRPVARALLSRAADLVYSAGYAWITPGCRAAGDQ